MVTGDTGRLSEDLHFTSLGIPEDPEGILRDSFERDHHGVRFSVVSPYRTARRNWACRVGYRHEWDVGEFRLEISYREKTFLAPRLWAALPQPSFDALPFAPPEIPCLRVEESMAEKLRAIQQRATERDLYDATRYGRKGFDEALVRLLAVAKLWNDREGFRARTRSRAHFPEADRTGPISSVSSGAPDGEIGIGRRRRPVVASDSSAR